MIFYGNKMDCVQFATDLQIALPDAWLSTTITRVGTSGVYSVSTAIDGLSDDTVEKMARTCSLRDTPISPLNTLDDVEKTVQLLTSSSRRKK